MTPAEQKPTGPTYAAVLRCTNCDRVSVVLVPKGVTVVEYADSRTCTDCGCKTMRPRWNTE